jgi:hypothetical protein
MYMEEDQKAFVGGGRHQVQLHCYMCGKVIYGQNAIESEYKKQHSQWLSSNSTEGTSPNAGLSSEGRDDADSSVSADDKASDSNGKEMPQCAWRNCEKTARPRSKYCSRNCSNKNARSRYSRRNDEEAA